MAQRVVSVSISPVGTLNYLGPGQSVNLVANVVTAGSGPPIDTSVSWTNATSTGAHTATFTAGADSQPLRGDGTALWTLVQAVANWQSNSVVDVSGTSVSWDSGDDFSAWARGASVAINGQAFLIASVTSTTSATLSSSAGTLTGATATLIVLAGSIAIPIGPVVVNLVPPGQLTYPGFSFPMASCLKVVGATNPAVTWSCDVGSIDSSGNFTALSPGVTGAFSALVTATSVEDSAQSSSVAVGIYNW